MKWISISESLPAALSTSGPNEAISADKTKQASLWVEAAPATDNNVDGYSKQKLFEKISAPMADTPRLNFSKKNSLVLTPAKA